MINLKNDPPRPNKKLEAHEDNFVNQSLEVAVKFRCQSTSDETGLRRVLHPLQFLFYKAVSLFLQL